MTENIKQLNSLEFIVWTQAGFKQATKKVHAMYEGLREIEGYPKQYPSHIRFSGQYRGYHYWYVACTPLNKYIEELTRKLETIVDADSKHRAELDT